MLIKHAKLVLLWYVEECGSVLSAPSFCEVMSQSELTTLLINLPNSAPFCSLGDSTSLLLSASSLTSGFCLSLIPVSTPGLRSTSSSSSSSSSSGTSGSSSSGGSSSSYPKNELQNQALLCFRTIPTYNALMGSSVSMYKDSKRTLVAIVFITLPTKMQLHAKWCHKSIILLQP